MTSMNALFQNATSTGPHIVTDGVGGLQTRSASAAQAFAGLFTTTGITAGGAGSVPGAVGSTGFCLTSDGFWANYIVLATGPGGAISVRMWHNANRALDGGVPTSAATVDFWVKPCPLADYLRTMIEDISIFTNTAGTTLTIKDSLGGTIFTDIVAATVIPVSIPLPSDGLAIKGPLFITQSATAQLFGSITFRGNIATTVSATTPVM